MAEVAQHSLRVTQKSVLSQGGGVFNGKLEVVAIPVDATKLTFTANVKAYTGASTFVEYSAADDKGKIKTFGSLDLIITWLKGAYLDITDLSILVSDVEEISKEYVPPSDALKDATSKKSSFTKLLAANEERLTAANLDVTRAEAAGWDAVGAHPTLTANYNELVARVTALNSAKTYFNARIAYFDSIINP